MNKIDEMIRELCPEGVKRLKLGDVAVIGTGSSNRQDASENGRYPFFVRSKDILHIDNYEFDEEAILIPGEGGIGDIFHYYKGKYGLHQRTYRIAVSSVCDCKYVYYYMYSHFKTFILSKAVTGSVSSIRKPMIDGFEIPLPPLAIQQEIVSILDSFSSLQSKLEEELAVRQKQMEFYREKLLTFDKDDNSVKWMKLGEVADYSTGLTYKPTDVCEQGVLVLRSSNIKDNALCFEDNVYVDIDIPSRAIVQTNDILICVRNGSKRLVGKCAFITEKANGMAFGAFMNILRAKNVDSKFLYYSWLSDYVVKQYKGNDEMPISQITNKDFSRMIIPLPPLSRQQEIVSTLDTMSSLIDKLKEEIELRKKQYEYYREALLSF